MSCLLAVTCGLPVHPHLPRYSIHIVSPHVFLELGPEIVLLEGRICSSGMGHDDSLLGFLSSPQDLPWLQEFYCKMAFICKTPMCIICKTLMHSPYWHSSSRPVTLVMQRPQLISVKNKLWPCA